MSKRNDWIILTAFNGLLRSELKHFSFDTGHELRIPVIPQTDYSMLFDNTQPFRPSYQRFIDTGRREDLGNGWYARIFELVPPE